MPDIISMDIIFKSGGGLLFGEIYYHGSGVDTVLAAQDTWYQVLGFATDGLSNGTTPDHTNDHIIVPTAGIYQVFFKEGSRSAASNTYRFMVKKNNGTVDAMNIMTHRVTSVAGKIAPGSCMGYVDCAANDTIELWVNRVDGGAVSKTITHEHLNLNVMQIGGT